MREKSVVLVLCAIVLVCAGSGDFRRATTAQEFPTIVVPDDYPTIQEAINNANDGDTISVRVGTYYGCVVLNKSLNLIGEDRVTTIIDGNGTGNVVTINTDRVNMTGLRVQDSGSTAGAMGIRLDGAGLCNVSGNNIRDNFDSGIGLERSSSNLIAANSIVTNDVVTNLEGGIALVYSHNNTVTGNYVALHGIVGIAVAWSHDNTLSFNNVTQIAGSPDFHGINLWQSERNRISQNRVWTNRRYGIRIEGQSNNNTLSDNSIDNCPTGLQVCGSSNHNTLSRNTVTGAEYGVRIQDYAGYTCIAENIIEENYCGIQIQYAANTEIFNNTIAHNYGGEWDAGIRLDYADYTRIYANVIVDNSRGILVYAGSPRVSIYGNTVSGNEFGIRVASGGSEYVNISDNIVTNNRGYGIGLTGFGGASDYATISRNHIVNNSDGIALGQYSNYHAIFHNNMSHNDCGFYIEYSTQNMIWGNNIVDNDQQVHVSAGSFNTWSDGYPTGGNYWSDCVSVDVRNGPNQDLLGSDGIGDAPHIIDSNNRDLYPLMKPYPWDPHDLGITSVAVSRTVVGQGYAVRLNVTIFNYGNNTEHLNATVYANTTIVYTAENLMLASRDSTTVIFTWNTTGWAKGNYTLSVVADLVLGETDTADNTLDSWAFVTLAGDVDGNRQVGFFDLVAIAEVYGVSLPDPRYVPNCDVDDDGDIDIFDIVLAAGNYGKSW